MMMIIVITVVISNHLIIVAEINLLTDKEPIFLFLIYFNDQEGC